MKKEKKFTLQAAALSAAGIAGTVLWQKKDLLKAMVQLRRYPEGWVLLQKEPDVFLTKTSEKSRENLFSYLKQSPWRLVDQVADGYFWMNEKEEVLLLTQKKIMKDYWSWTASRPFFDAAENPVAFEEVEAAPEDYDYDMTQVESAPESPVTGAAEASAPEEENQTTADQEVSG